MFTMTTLAMLTQSTDDGLTWTEVADSLPTDTASIVVLLLLIASFALVLWTGTRPRGKGPRAV